MPMDIPEILQSKAWFIEKHLSDLLPPLRDYVTKLLLISDFACRQIQLLKPLVTEESCFFCLPGIIIFALWQNCTSL